MRPLTLRLLTEVLVESARTSAMLFTIVIGASLFAGFLNFTELPSALREFVSGVGAHPMVVIVATIRSQIHSIAQDGPKAATVDQATRYIPFVGTLFLNALKMLRDI